MSLQKIVKESDFESWESLFSELANKPVGYIYEYEDKSKSGLLFAKVLKDSIELVYKKLDLNLFKKVTDSIGSNRFIGLRFKSSDGHQEIQIVESFEKPIMKISDKTILVYEMNKSVKLLEEYDSAYFMRSIDRSFY